MPTRLEELYLSSGCGKPGSRRQGRRLPEPRRTWGSALFHSDDDYRESEGARLVGASVESGLRPDLQRYGHAFGVCCGSMKLLSSFGKRRDLPLGVFGIDSHLPWNGKVTTSLRARCAKGHCIHPCQKVASIVPKTVRLDGRTFLQARLATKHQYRRWRLCS